MNENWENILKKGMEEYNLSIDSKGNFNLFHELYHPEIGDLVYELTTSYMYPLRSLGFLLAIDYNKGDTKYYILSPITKEVTPWINSKFIKIKDYKFYKYEKMFDPGVTPIFKGI